MTDKVRVALCRYKRDNPQLSQKDLIKWLEDNHSIKVSQTTISTTLKRSTKILAKSDNETNLNAKHQRTIKYPEMESTLVLLIMDNFSGHIPLDQLPNHIQLRNTTVFYLPPNATSKIQPCDAGIICSFKAYYRCRFNRLLL
jgi:hypothetical protein